MSFVKQAVLATLVVAGCVGGLYFFRQTKGDGVHASSDSDVSTGQDSALPSRPLSPNSLPSKLPQGEQDVPREGPLSPAEQTRDLAPLFAWLVADFRGDITGQKPFAGEPGLCASVPAPDRVAVAVLPPKTGTEPDLLIAARKVEDVFWGCARDMIVRAGGTALAQNERYEVLKSPSGIVAHGPDGSLVFLTSEGHLEEALSVLSELTPGAARSGTHARLYSRMHAGGRPAKDSMMDVTLALPPDWLSSVGQAEEKTPLRFISSAFLTSHVDGSAQGGIDCVEAGCAEVLEFLERAQKDVLESLPPATRAGIGEALNMKHVAGAGRIAIEWDPSRVSLGSLVGQLLGLGPLGK